jgi:hypothetical protein
MFGREHYTIALANISDKGLNRGHLSADIVEMLKRVRDARSNHKRLEILQKNLY